MPLGTAAFHSNPRRTLGAVHRADILSMGLFFGFSHN